MTGIIDDAGSKLLTAGIVSLKLANPNAWAAFKRSLKCVAMGVCALDEITDDDKVSAEEVSNVLAMARDYGAVRTLQDMLWGLLKHVKG
jgi:hypothetical protein